ncbi:ATP-binding protein [Actinomadura madurae]|uniref:ATP-binding protein n=1 Tax=Actinomadura madurae TaxID=1993 RepID=UPI0020D255AE|nr:ATP-binding protein [Actinomadura madurae]MCP9981083.1 ATP-binding protein [Actinomadura madurae]
MTLPRNAESAPLVRHTLDASLRGLGVGSEIRADIALALGEACANVIQHAAAGMEYEVRARMDGARCVVDVIDGGHGRRGGRSRRLGGRAGAAARRARAGAAADAGVHGGPADRRAGPEQGLGRAFREVAGGLTGMETARRAVAHRAAHRAPVSR